MKPSIVKTSYKSNPDFYRYYFRLAILNSKHRWYEEVKQRISMVPINTTELLKMADSIEQELQNRETSKPFTDVVFILCTSIEERGCFLQPSIS